MTEEEKQLIRIQTTIFFITSLASVFLNVYFFNLGSFKSVYFYNLATFIALLITYIASGYLLKKFSSKDLIVISLFLLGLLYLLIFVFKESSINYLIFLGLLNGMGMGSYWAGYNLSQFILTNEDTRHNYFGNVLFWSNASHAIGPLVGGAIIRIFEVISTKQIGYEAVFLLVGVLTFYNIFLALKLPIHKGVSFTISDILKHKRSLSWKLVLTQQFFFGLWDVSFNVISVILIFLIVKQEFVLGAITTVATLAFAFGSLLTGKLLQKNENIFILGSFFTSIGLLIFGLQQNFLGILSVILLIRFFWPFLHIPTSKAILDTPDSEIGSWQEKYHYLIERDVALGIARILSYIILLLLLTETNQITLAKTWILVIAVLPLIVGLIHYRYLVSLRKV